MGRERGRGSRGRRHGGGAARRPWAWRRSAAALAGSARRAALSIAVGSSSPSTGECGGRGAGVESSQAPRGSRPPSCAGPAGREGVRRAACGVRRAGQARRAARWTAGGRRREQAGAGGGYGGQTVLAGRVLTEGVLFAWQSRGHVVGRAGEVSTTSAAITLVSAVQRLGRPASCSPTNAQRSAPKSEPAGARTLLAFSAQQQNPPSGAVNAGPARSDACKCHGCRWTACAH